MLFRKLAKDFRTFFSFTHEKVRNRGNLFLLCSLIRTLASPKILSLDNKNKYIYFVLFSLIRIFASQKSEGNVQTHHIYNILDAYQRMLVQP